MSRFTLAALLALALWGCTSTTGTTSGNLVGTNGMVVVDALADDGGSIATFDGGLPNHYVFVSSSAGNELRVLQFYWPGITTKETDFVRAPDPLEALSIPVLDRPTNLFADEGTSSDGRRRVTGRFVYATRAGAAELSVVDAAASGFVQVTPSPLVMPAPITAGLAWIGSGIFQIPPTTTVYLGTFDGSTGTVYRLVLPTDFARRAEVSQAKPQRLLDLGSEVVTAMAVVPGLDGRTLDGQPFCAGASDCLALATRSAAGLSGRNLLLELDTGHLATLAFPGPVNFLRVSGDGQRIHGALDEEKCDAVSCGGILEIDSLTGTSASGFPVMTDFSGQPMLPIQRSGAVVRGLWVAEAHPISGNNQAVLTVNEIVESADAGQVKFDELGVFSVSANGETCLYDGLAGVPIDYDGNRTELSAAVVRIPFQEPDGGYIFYYDDGGVAWTELTGTYKALTPAANPNGAGTVPQRDYDTIEVATNASTVWNSADVPFTLSVADGYLFTQNILVVNQGWIPGVTALGTSSGDGDQVYFTAGMETRLAIDDRVQFTASLADGGTEVCGESTISSLGSGVAQVTPVPASCASRTSYTAYAAGAHPIVISADLEGYIARGAVGETVTYNRRYVVKPEGYDGVRPAMVMKIGAVPPQPGAHWLFGLTGHLSLYRLTYDFSATTSNTQQCVPTTVPGPVALVEIPAITSTTPLQFPWELLTLFPSSSSVVVQPLTAAVANSYLGSALTDSPSGTAAYCWH